MNELTEADKGRIEKQALEYSTKMSSAPDKETPNWIITDFRKGAEYATLYEREKARELRELLQEAIKCIEQNTGSWVTPDYLNLVARIRKALTK